MARDYSVEDLFRQTPNALLARYFAARGLFAGLDAGAMKEGKSDELSDGWIAVPDEDRRRTDADFRDIDNMRNEKGRCLAALRSALNQTIVRRRGMSNWATQRREMLRGWTDCIQQLMTAGAVMLARFKQVA